MKTIKLTLALLVFAICMGSCAMILGIDSNTLMKIQKGMTKEEITSILGQPMHRSFDHEVEGWRYEKSISGAPGIDVYKRQVDDIACLFGAYHQNRTCSR